MPQAIKKWLLSPIMENRRHKWQREIMGFAATLARGLILVGICYVILSPLIGIVTAAFKSLSDLYNPLVYIVPEFPTFDNFRNAYQFLDYGRMLFVTLRYTLGITVLQVVVTSLVGYGFARFRFPGRNVLFGLVIATFVLPVQVYMTPMYMQFRYFSFFGLFEQNLLNTYAPMILLTLTGVGLRSGLYIFIFRQFFRGLPKEIEEAALIDGAGQLRTYLTVMLPNAVPAIITVAMFSFVWQYNDTYYWSSFMTSVRSLPAVLASLGNTFINSFDTVIPPDPRLAELVVNAGVVLTILPVLAVYLLLQRYFMEGLERSGIVG